MLLRQKHDERYEECTSLRSLTSKRTHNSYTFRYSWNYTDMHSIGLHNNGLSVSITPEHCVLPSECNDLGISHSTVPEAENRLLRIIDLTWAT